MKRKILTLAGVMLLSLLLWGCEKQAAGEAEEEIQIGEQEEEAEEAEEARLRAGSGEMAECFGSREQLLMWEDALTLSEDEIYTFFQGPKAWEQGMPWGGEWCVYWVKGQYFGGFGCGLVCMANIYSTLSPYECSPLDMFRFALENTGYSPSRENAAIDWGPMKAVLRQAGFSCDLFYKPQSYEEFQEHMSQVDTAVMLVCSANDNTYWKDIPGHYVTVWLYDEDTDMVFLGDSGDPTHNRTWIPLRYVYDALKTSSKFQYLAVWDYTEEANTWKWDGIYDNWNKP